MFGTTVTHAPASEKGLARKCDREFTEETEGRGDGASDRYDAALTIRDTLCGLQETACRHDFQMLAYLLSLAIMEVEDYLTRSVR